MRLHLIVFEIVFQGVAKTLQKKCVADMEPSEEDSLFFNAYFLMCNTFDEVLVLFYWLTLVFFFSLLNANGQCLFPQHIIKNINTPVFLVNPAYDFWQVSQFPEYIISILIHSSSCGFLLILNWMTFRYNISWYRMHQILKATGRNAD